MPYPPADNLAGSPPHGRGIVKAIRKKIEDERITPAWAGNSFDVTEFFYFIKDHPRMGGE